MPIPHHNYSPFSRVMTRALRAALGGLLLVAGSAASVSAAKWSNLLDKELSQWDTYLSFRHKVGYDGTAPVDEAGKPVEPVGYGKNEANVFSTVSMNGELVLRISGEIYGCLISKQEYANYRLRLKVKWGQDKWDPRKEKAARLRHSLPLRRPSRSGLLARLDALAGIPDHGRPHG
jgi:hypothetical protein